MNHSEFALDLDEIPVIDNHCHPPMKSRIETESGLKRFFTESFDPRIVSDHVQHTLFYQQSLRDIGALLGCEPDVDALLTDRNLLGTAGLIRRGVPPANMRGWVMDFGYQGDGTPTFDYVRAILR